MNTSRRFVLQTCLGALAAASVHGCGQSWSSSSQLEVSSSLLDRIKKRGYLLVATEDDYPPFEFLISGQSTGYDNDLLAQLRAIVPFEIRQEVRPWQDILPGVQSGLYDAAVTAVGITDERAKFLDFTTPIAEATIAYVKRQDDRSITTIADLSKKALGAQQGGVSLSAIPDLKATLQKQGGTLGVVREYRNFTEAYQDLLNKRIDAVLHNIVSLSVLVNDKPAIFALGDRVGRISYAAWAVKKGDRDLQALFNRFLLGARQRGDMTKLQQKWFKIVFDQMPTEPKLPGNRSII